MNVKNERLVQLRDDAFAASKASHDEMRAALLIFANKAYQPGITRVGRVFSFAEKSFDSEIQKGILKLIPVIEAQIPRISILADRSARSETEVLLAEDLEQWKDMYDEADEIGDFRHDFIKQFLVLGNAVSKEIWNVEQERCEAILVDPTCFAPDPAATRVDFSDAEYVCHRTYHNERALKKRYPDWKPPPYQEQQKRRTKDNRLSRNWRVDELWIRRDWAEWAGIDVSGTKREIIRVVLIEDIVYKAWGSPYWEGTFPFQFARCFTKLSATGWARQFWGFGYASLMWEQQKVYDEVIANAILVMRNQAVGRFLSKEGTLDMAQIPAAHGLNIELNAESNMDDIQPLPSDPVPPAMFQWIEMLSGKISQFIPSGNPVLSGEAPFSGVSGRTVSFLQSAAIGITDSQVLAIVACFVRAARSRVHRIQQFAHRPVKPEMLRTALDLREPFPEEAAQIGFGLSVPDTTSLPMTPMGKLEVLSVFNGMLAQSGQHIDPAKLVEIIGLDKSYGIRAEDLVALLPPGMEGMGGMLGMPNQDVGMGVETMGTQGLNASP